MRCVSCGTATRFHRAVVRLDDGRVHAGLCQDCDPTPARDISDGVTGGTLECDHCDGVAVYALPEHRLEVSIVDGAEHESSGYPIEEETPLRCELHGPVPAEGEAPEVSTTPGAVPVAPTDD